MKGILMIVIIANVRYIIEITILKMVDVKVCYVIQALNYEPSAGSDLCLSLSKTKE